jgi:hypothetical protein
MFFIRKKGQYWTGKGWSEDQSKASVYSFAAEAIANFPVKYADDCAAVGLTSDQWAALPKARREMEGQP